jgi:hypothetical protein
VIVQPAAYEVSYGLVTGWVAKGTQRIVILAGAQKLADARVAGRHFTVRVDLSPAGARAVGHGHRRWRAWLDEPRCQRLDPALAERIRGLVAGYGGTCAVFVENLTDGSGAAWNARARFPAASTLKLAIAATALARNDDDTGPGTLADSLLRRMLEDSDNDAADTLMYGGYEPDLAARIRFRSAPTTSRASRAASTRVPATPLACSARSGLPRTGAGYSVHASRRSRRGLRGTSSTSSAASATAASSIAKWAELQACRCSTRQGGSAWFATTTGSSSGVAVCSSRRS